MIQALFDAKFLGIRVSLLIYYLFTFLDLAAALAFNLWYAKKIDVKKWKAVTATVSIWLLGTLWIYFLCWAETGFTNFGGNNIVRGFIYFPLIAIGVAKVLKMEAKKAIELIGPTVCIVRGVGHLGCIFEGCCHGYESAFGIWNPLTQTYTFPIQPIEALTAIFIAVFVIYLAKRRNYEVDGTSYPIMLILFGVTRFLLEFARDNRKLWLGISNLAFHALFMAVVGAIALYFVLANKREKLQRANNRKPHKAKK